MTIHIPTDQFQPEASALPSPRAPTLNPSRRADGWSADNQRLFLEMIAEGHGVETACLRVGLSTSSAYAFRRTAKGAAFALGWRAATLLARECVAETLLVRALEGQVDTVNRADGSVVTRHRFDNRLAMSLLARLDRQVEQAPDADIKAARLVAQEFDAFLDLVEHDAGPARAGLFVARRSLGGEGEADLAPIAALAAADRFLRTGVATAAEVDIADLDPAARAGWSAAQWARAEAAGLLAFAAPEEETPPACQHCQHSAAADDAASEPPDMVWWCNVGEEWRTSFPPSDDFYGEESGRPGEPEYTRQLSDTEKWLVDRMEDAGPAELAAQAEARDRFFAALAAERPARDAGTQPPPAGYGTDDPSQGSDDYGDQAPQDDDDDQA